MTRPDPYQLVHLAEEFCLAESSDGFVCSEDVGHDGWHRAAAADGELFDTWPP